MLPVVRQLRIESYVSFSENCEYLKYARGAFTTKPDDEFCRVFPAGDDGTWAPQPFDDQARTDLEQLHREVELRGARIPGASLRIFFDQDGSIAPGSEFNFGGCDSYVYSPGQATPPWSRELDEGVIATGLDSNWYKVESCTRANAWRGRRELMASR
jgi:hypothetical protein